MTKGVSREPRTVFRKDGLLQMGALRTQALTVARRGIIVYLEYQSVCHIVGFAGEGTQFGRLDIESPALRILRAGARLHLQ